MPTTVRRIPVPQSSILRDQLPGADFDDAYEMTLDHHGRTALAIYLDMVGRTPAWVERLMAARNRIVVLLGLKDLGLRGQVDRSKPAAGDGFDPIVAWK